MLSEILPNSFYSERGRNIYEEDEVQDLSLVKKAI